MPDLEQCSGISSKPCQPVSYISTVRSIDWKFSPGCPGNSSGKLPVCSPTASAGKQTADLQFQKADFKEPGQMSWLVTTSCRAFGKNLFLCMLIQVPTALLLRQSVKTQHSTSYTVTVQASANATNSEHSNADKQEAPKQAGQTAANQICLQFIACFGLFMTCLLLLSDIQLSSYSDHFTTTVFSQSQMHSKGRSTLPLGASRPMHWTQHVYGYMILVSLSHSPLCHCNCGN